MDYKHIYITTIIDNIIIQMTEMDVDIIMDYSDEYVFMGGCNELHIPKTCQLRKEDDCDVYISKHYSFIIREDK